MSWEDYKGMQVPSTTSGDAGTALKTNFMTLADRAPKANFGDIINPSATNDSTEGYEVGSQWINITTGAIFVCVDNTEDAAVWKGSTFHDGSGDNSVIGGGLNNIASGNYSAVGGGFYNSALGESSVVGGGAGNVSNGSRNTISGGSDNTTAGTYSTVVGGLFNDATGNKSLIGGGSYNTASGNFSAISGGEYNSAGEHGCIIGGAANSAGYFSVSSGGENNESTGNFNVIGGGRSNASDQDYSSISGGYANTAGYGGSVGGGRENSATGAYSTVCGGQGNEANGSFGAVLGGYLNISSGGYSTAMGSQAVASQYGQLAHAAGGFSEDGDAQRSVFILRAETTDNTPTELSLDNFGISYLTIATDRALLLQIQILAIESGATNAMSFTRQCLIVNNGGTTALVGSVDTIGTDKGSSGWSVSITADNTNDRLAITVTGASSTNIRWVATVYATEVKYA